MGLFCLQVLVRGFESAGHDGLVGLAEADVGHAHAAPSSLDGRKDVGLVRDEGLLLFDGDLEDTEASFLTGEGCEDAVVEAEVGVGLCDRLYFLRKIKGSFS